MLENEAWTKSLEKCSKTCFSTEVAAAKSRSRRATLCAVLYNVHFAVCALCSLCTLCSLQFAQWNATSIVQCNALLLTLKPPKPPQDFCRIPMQIPTLHCEFQHPTTQIVNREMDTDLQQKLHRHRLLRCTWAPPDGKQWLSHFSSHPLASHQQQQ